ncbi:MAG: Rieske 2Fe-2S domain-containing protein [Burkholderiales bacterium]|nr:Rieske 2Fe-2S domain-containing protein [Burkholderiales bacterium]ODU71784.1 MAG: hypothetical protein ABT05_00905 [Lautropia sp. SCN 66-9]
MGVDFKQLAGVGRGRLDRRIFVEDAIYRMELEKIFAKCWLFLCHESQIPKPFDYFTTYMGADPVIVTRKEDGSIGCYLNMCRHRGNRVCRGDAGNAKSFVCPFHGWSYSIDGSLNHVPGHQEVYYGELDIDSHGLVPVAQIDSYKGLVFATFDANAPSLLEYLGDMAWYLDMFLDRRERGIEFCSGTHKWRIKCNWKFPADNFVGDTYHGLVSHISAWKAGFEGTPRRKVDYGYQGYQINPGNGHGLGALWTETPERFVDSALPELQQYEAARLKEAEARLGPVRAWKIAGIHGTIFPNLSLLFQAGAIRVWHPIAPNVTEAWSWGFVDKDAPQDFKDEMRRHVTHRHSTSGTWEADDVDNWVQSTNASYGHVAQRYEQNLQMGQGHEATHPELRGTVGQIQSEINQRGFYQRWAELLAEGQPGAM